MNSAVFAINRPAPPGQCWSAPVCDRGADRQGWSGYDTERAEQLRRRSAAASRALSELTTFVDATREFSVAQRALVFACAFDVVHGRRAITAHEELPDLLSTESLAKLCIAIAGLVSPLDAAAVEIAAVLVRDSANGSCEQLFQVASRLVS